MYNMGYGAFAFSFWGGAVGTMNNVAPSPLVWDQLGNKTWEAEQHLNVNFMVNFMVDTN